MTVSKRLGLGFAVLLLAQLLIGLIGLQSLADLRADVDQVESLRQTRLSTTRDLQDGIGQIGLHSRALALLDAPLQLSREARLLAQQQTRVQQLEQTLRGLDWAPEQRTVVDAVLGAGAAARPLIDAAARMGHEGQNREAVQELLKQVGPAELQWREQTRRLTQTLIEQGQRAAAAAQARHEQAVGLIAVVTLACLLAGSAMAWALVRSVREPVDQAVRMAEGLMHGSEPAHTPQLQGDELDRLHHAMTGLQRRLREGTLRGIDSHATAAPQPAADLPPSLSQSVADFSERPAAAPAASNRPIAADAEGGFVATPSLDAMASLPSLHAGLAGAPVSAQALAINAARVAERGGEVVTQVVSNMEDISASNRKINEILATIDGIAFQTNILALNAAVQAARAGQDSQGAGAVAGEVRGLAQRAASAAREIKGLITASVEKAEAGTRLARDAGATMDAIVSSVQSVTDLVGQITQHPSDEAAKLAEADLSVRRLDDLTRQNAALVEQSASAADALRQQAERLQKVVGAFRLLQQTQEAAWTAHTAIHSARTSARGETQPGGLDPLGGPGSDAGGGHDGPDGARKGSRPPRPGPERGWSNF
ncbi:methyl-accepting chemotaxis sensory transducer [Leptothrix cholodnii SP-6]|uniref:Methyl-accepting chemotaxis sensory transducer n=1 Tax=Leptothrix cholodnii (strain ATCC 51168 / LMG 8142 / SP-6) TaxID=395495 RepID=B1XZ58_LEPCP|nr:methyl-accepting chemotaxis protein [Leptothrix cholodnii]ACB35228.1 methyl-accepting chemotaxis sensory transducer [Leptothrix cholodnii SP-6]